MNSRLVTLSALSIAALVTIASGNTTLRRSVIASGGGSVVVASTTLKFTIGQPIVGLFAADAHTVNAGFWKGEAGCCFADCNCDGGIDGGDIECFFRSWQAGDTLADCNGDGGVDGGDVACFFIQWETGGCD